MRVFFALLLTAGLASANGARPPEPPKGKKAVPVAVEVILDKEVKGYVLYSNIWWNSRERLEANSEKAVGVSPDVLRILGHHFTAVYAVPEDFEPKLKKLDDWDNASKEDKARVLRHEFDGYEFVDKSDERKAMTKTYLIKSIDAKSGIKVEEVKDEKKPAEKKDKPLALSEPGTLIGGLAAAVSITLGGLWLARRRR